MTVNEVMAKIKASKTPQAVFVLRHKLSVVGVGTARFRQLTGAGRTTLVGVYDAGVQRTWLEEDLDSWLEGFEGLQ